MRITSRGQVTIPQNIRERLGLQPHTEVEFIVDGNAVQIRKVTGAERRGEAIVAHLRGRGSIRMTTDEILALTRGDS